MRCISSYSIGLIASANLNGFIFFCCTLGIIDVVVIPADVDGTSAGSLPIVNATAGFPSMSADDDGNESSRPTPVTLVMGFTSSISSSIFGFTC